MKKQTSYFSLIVICLLLSTNLSAQLINKNEYIKLNDELYTQYSPLEKGWIIYKLEKRDGKYLRQVFTDRLSTGEKSVFKEIFEADQYSIFIREDKTFKLLDLYSNEINSEYKEITVYSLPVINRTVRHIIGKKPDNTYISLSDRPMSCDTFLIQNGTFIPILKKDNPEIDRNIFTPNGFLVPHMYGIIGYTYSIRNTPGGFILSDRRIMFNQMGYLIHSYPEMGYGHKNPEIFRQFPEGIVLSYYNGKNFLISEKDKWYICKVPENEINFKTYLSDSKNIIPKDELLSEYFGTLEASDIRVLNWESGIPAYFIATIQGVDHLYDYRKRDIKGSNRKISFLQDEGISGESIKAYYTETGKSADDTGQDEKPVYLFVKNKAAISYYKYSDGQFIKENKFPFTGSFKLAFTGSAFREFGSDSATQVLKEKVFIPDLQPFELEYLNLKAKPDLQSARNYKSKYPGSIYVSLADSLIEEFEYDLVIKLNTVEGYDEYMRKYPSGKYTDILLAKKNILECALIKDQKKEEFQRIMDAFKKASPKTDPGPQTVSPPIDPYYSVFSEKMDKYSDEYYKDFGLISGIGIRAFQITDSAKVAPWFGDPLGKSKIALLRNSRNLQSIVSGQLLSLKNDRLAVLKGFEITDRQTNTINGRDYYSNTKYRFDKYGNIIYYEEALARQDPVNANIDYKYDDEGKILRVDIRANYSRQNSSISNETIYYRHDIKWENDKILYWFFGQNDKIRSRETCYLLMFEYNPDETIRKINKAEIRWYEFSSFLKKQSVTVEMKTATYSDIKNLDLDLLAVFCYETNKFKIEAELYYNEDKYLSYLKTYERILDLYYFKNALFLSKSNISRRYQDTAGQRMLVETTGFRQSDIFIYSHDYGNQPRLAAKFEVTGKDECITQKLRSYTDDNQYGGYRPIEINNPGTSTEQEVLYTKNGLLPSRAVRKDNSQTRIFKYDENGDQIEVESLEGLPGEVYKQKWITTYNSFGPVKTLFYNAFKSDYKLSNEVTFTYLY